MADGVLKKRGKFAWHMENDIVFLVKTLKKEYLQSTLEGKLFFSCPDTFISTGNNLASGQQDIYDSHLNFMAHHLVVAPIIKEDENGIQYGKGMKIADSAYMHRINETSRHSPMICFRKVDVSDIKVVDECKIFALGNLVDRIKAEMGHDAFIIILAPLAFHKRLNEKERFFGRSIHYGEIDGQFQRFLDEHPSEQKEMFQKRTEYAWQKEYRIALSPREETSPLIVDIGSIEDIAIGGDIEMLRDGIVIAETEEQLQKCSYFTHK